MVSHWLFVQAERPQVSGDTVVMFKETREGTMPAVQYWYFPGERIGKEFLYPKDQAQRIAARTGLDVRTEDGVIEGDGIAGVQAETTVAADTTLQNAPASAQPTASAGSLAGNRGLEVEAQAPAPLPVEVDINAGAADNRVAASADVSANRPVGTSGAAEGQIARDDRANELPRTASPLALSGLLGLRALAGAARL